MSGSVSIFDQFRQDSRNDSTNNAAPQTPANPSKYRLRRGPDKGTDTSSNSTPIVTFPPSGESLNNSNNGSNIGLQALFPTADQAPASSNKPLKGKANFSDPISAATPAKRPSIWQISALGGYYDVTGQVPGTVRGDKLYIYGGTMSDGLTPVPTGPVSTNSSGHFPWTPLGMH